MNLCGIYSNKKLVYVGQTVNSVQDRISKHKGDARLGKNTKLAESTRKKISEVQKKKILCVDDRICFYSVIECESFYNAGKGTIGRVTHGLRNFYRGKNLNLLTQLQRLQVGANKEMPYRKPKI